MCEKIRILKGADRVRLRPAVIFGSDGAKTALEMVLSVMTAECSAGYSDRVIFTLHDDNSIEIEDFGRGIYLGSMPSSGWKEIFCELFAGSRNYPDLLSPEFSLFEKENSIDKKSYLFGCYDELTLSAVQFASAFMNVRIRRDNHEMCLSFLKGENVGGLIDKPYAGASGTRIHFKLDPTVFSDIHIPIEHLKNQAHKFALMTPGVKVILKIGNTDSTPMVYSYPNGIIEYLQCENDFLNETPIFYSSLSAEGQDRYNWPHYSAEIQIGISVAQGAPHQEYYHNGRELTYGGTHIQAVFKEIKQQLEWKLGKRCNDADIKRLFNVIVITRSSQYATRWVNGTRTSIENAVIADMAKDSMGDSFGKFIKDNRDAIEIAFRSLKKDSRGVAK